MDFGTWCRNYRAIDRACSDRDRILAATVVQEPPFVHVYWGPTRSGKSQKVLQLIQELGLTAYWVARGTSVTWYDGLDASFGGKVFDCLVYDDFYGAESYPMILKILDRYTVQLQTKGAMIIKPVIKHVFFTSNNYPTEWWRKTHKKEFEKHGTHLSAFAARINELVHFEILPGTEVGGVVLTPQTSVASTAVSDIFELPNW